VCIGLTSAIACSLTRVCKPTCASDMLCVQCQLDGPQHERGMSCVWVCMRAESVHQCVSCMARLLLLLIQLLSVCVILQARDSGTVPETGAFTIAATRGMYISVYPPLLQPIMHTVGATGLGAARIMVSCFSASVLVLRCQRIVRHYSAVIFGMRHGQQHAASARDHDVAASCRSQVAALVPLPYTTSMRRAVECACRS
jgi:hypothetical protein